MANTYDKYYQTTNLFGNPYPELIQFFSVQPLKGRVLDLGCGQGRDAIAIARLGFSVVGIDNSKVGIEQMNKVAKAEKLNLIGKTEDVFQFNNFGEFDIILLDSMFHFLKKDLKKETDFIKNIISQLNANCLLNICIQDTGHKVDILNDTIDFEKKLHRVVDLKFKYAFEDQESGHKSESDYRMLVVQK